MRYLFAVFFFLSLLLSLPDHSQAAIPTGVIQVAEVAGTAVTVAGVGSAIIPASAVAGVPAVGTASAAGVTTPAVIPLAVGGIALAGGYAVGASLVTDIPALRDLVTSLPDKYQALKDAFAPVPPADGTPSLLPGQVFSTSSGNFRIISFLNFTVCPSYQIVGDACNGHDQFDCSTYLGGRCWKINGTSIYQYQEIYLAEQTSAAPSGIDPLTAEPASTPVSDADAVSNLSNSDGTLKPEVAADIKNALASGDVSASGATISGTSTQITPELLEQYGQQLASQNATDVASQTVEQLQDALAADPTNSTLVQQLSQAQAELAQAQAEQAAAEAAAAEAAAAAETATANLGPANTYDSTINIPDQKNITGLMNTFFDNSPLLGIVRSFQISTTDQQALFSFGTFWGQEITVDFTRWADVLAGCGAVLLVLSHAYAVFIVVRG
ncbi:MAG: hypothetical protein AB7T17_03470 [Geobacter sp.]